MIEKDINFIDSRKSIPIAKYKRMAVKGLPFLLLVSLAIIFYLWVQKTTENLKNQIVLMNEEYVEIERRIKALDEEKKVRVEASGKAAPERRVVIEQIIKDRNIVTPMKAQILQYIPENVYISGIRIVGRKQMSVDFTSGSYMDTLRLVLSLNNSGVYQELPLPNLRLSGDANTVSLNLILKN